MRNRIPRALAAALAWLAATAILGAIDTLARRETSAAVVVLPQVEVAAARPVGQRF